MKLRHYLDRVGFEGAARPTPEVLATLLRCHVLSVPFENLDVQLDVPVTNDVDAAFDKIVERGRGGWCYEQNGLFGWALSMIGFDVTRVAAAVGRDERGAAALANHLCLLVRMPDDQPITYLADVGFGGSMTTPIPLSESQHEQTPFRLSLRRLDDGYWRFQEEAAADTSNFDFLAEPGSEPALSDKCGQLQTDPESSFVLNLVAEKRTPEAHVSLRGRVLTTIAASGKTSTTLQSRDELVATLTTVFRLDVPQAGRLWDRVAARHEALFGG